MAKTSGKVSANARYESNPLLNVYVKYNSKLLGEFDKVEKRVLDAYQRGMLEKGATKTKVVKKIARQLHCPQAEINENLQSIEEKGGYLYEPGRSDYPVHEVIWGRRNKGDTFGEIAHALNLKNHVVSDTYYRIGTVCEGVSDIRPYKETYEAERAAERRDARLAVRNERRHSRGARAAPAEAAPAVEAAAPVPAVEAAPAAASAAPVAETPAAPEVAAPAASPAYTSQDTDRLPSPEEIGGDTRPIPGIEGAVEGEQNARQADADDLEGRTNTRIRIPGRMSIAKKVGCTLLAGALIAGSIAAYLNREYIGNYMFGKTTSESAQTDGEAPGEGAGRKIERLDKRDIETKVELENKAEADRKALEALEAQRRADEEAAAKKRADEEAEAKRVAAEEARVKAEADARARADEEARKATERQLEDAKRAADEAIRSSNEAARRGYGSRPKSKIAGVLYGPMPYEGGDGDDGEWEGSLADWAFGKSSVKTEEPKVEPKTEPKVEPKVEPKIEPKTPEDIKNIEEQRAAEAARKAAKGVPAETDGALMVSGISTSDGGVGLGVRASGSVRSGDISAEGNVFGRARVSDSSYRVVAGVSARGELKGKVKIRVDGGYETEGEEIESESVSVHNEGVPFIQHDRESGEQTSNRWVASGGVSVVPAKRVSVSIDYSHDDRTTEGRSTTETDIGFPNNSELPSVHVSNRVRSLSRTLDDVVVVKGSYDLGLIRPGIVLRGKRTAWNSDASVNDVRVIDTGDISGVLSGGFEVGFGNKDFRGRAIGFRNVGYSDGKIKDLETSQRVEGAANIVVPLSRFVTAGVGGEFANGVPKVRGLLFAGDSGKNLDSLAEFFAAIEDKTLFPDGVLDEQRFWDVYGRLAELGAKGIVVHGGVGGRNIGNLDNFELGAGVPLVIIPGIGDELKGSSIAALFEKNGREQRFFVGPRFLIPGSRFFVGPHYGFASGADRKRDSHEVGISGSGKF